ncbi:undecaprenyl phosphate N,N'-diacetylbacillosamine 1-phosphate transferase [Lachnospiraceae bacterium]|nr:undecaprenyl phosphate N,N'-diacetylbacillosamine 1-phosphate transferase [Lachnospiraceae bacterium]
MDQKKNRIYQKYIKRILDFVLSFTAFVVLSPVLLVTAALVRVKLGKPVIFRQERPGKDEKIFKLYKFRTMTDERDENGQLLPDDVRLTKFGKTLRSTSLDELPELWNIVKGDMSIVGPRPLLVRYLPLYNATQKHRHDVRPGFTGLAQVHGRNSISWEEKFDWDIRYVNHVTFFTDVKIILDTVRTVLKREGISSDTSVTMEEFRGNS